MKNSPFSHETKIRFMLYFFIFSKSRFRKSRIVFVRRQNAHTVMETSKINEKCLQHLEIQKGV